MSMAELEARCVDAWRTLALSKLPLLPTGEEIVRAVLADAGVDALIAERDKLQFILDNRPAINAGLPDSYIKWSQNIYVIERAAKIGANQ